MAWTPMTAEILALSSCFMTTFSRANQTETVASRCCLRAETMTGKIHIFSDSVCLRPFLMLETCA